MEGIVSYGAYIPRYRIDRSIIFKAMGWLNPATFLPGEKAVINYDEDAITMSVAAGMNCLEGMDKDKIDAMYFATTSSPFKERLSSQIISTAFDLRPDIRTADFTDTVKSGTTSLISAYDAVKSGGAKNVMVCASDCCTGKAGSAQEEIFGDGAASIIMGSEDVIAVLKGHHSVSYDFIDHWRADGEIFDRQWEDRFIRDVGYKKFITEAISGLLKKCGVDIKDISKIAYPCLYAGDHKNIAKKMGFDQSQVQPPMISNMGYTGSGDPLITLIAALEDANPGDKIVIASFGSGSDALLFEVTDKINDIKANRKGVKKNLAAGRKLDSYEKMISFRNILPTEKGIRGLEMPFTALSGLWRNRREVLGLCGTRCKACNTPQFPAQSICVNPDCGAVNQMEPYRFSDKKATLFTYTGDNLAFTPNPPAIYGMIDFDGGGRYWFDITDADLESTKVGMKVEMSLRKKYVDEKFGINGYFWKAVPVIE